VRNITQLTRHHLVDPVAVMHLMCTDPMEDESSGFVVSDYFVDDLAQPSLLYCTYHQA
jgi:hypothetical protein